MVSFKFLSQRVKKYVVIVITFDKVWFIQDDDTCNCINRDFSWHLNDDGLYRAEDFFEDPRFDFFCNQSEMCGDIEL